MVSIFKEPIRFSSTKTLTTSYHRLLYLIMSIHLFIALFITFGKEISVFSQNCPSTAYVECGSQVTAGGAGVCNIPNGIEEGYVSYGAIDTWVLTPFTNTNTGYTDFNILCGSNADGTNDPKFGFIKYCCYVEALTGVQSITFGAEITGWQTYASLPSTNHITLKQCYENTCAYRPFNGEDIPCNSEYFGDVAYGFVKYCAKSSDSLPGLPGPDSDNWAICANEGGTCAGLDTGSLNWVKYGDDDHYFYRLVISHTGAIPCTNTVFQDPYFGHIKYCYRADPLIQISNIVGSWVTLQSCIGCAEHTYTKTVGVTELTESEVTDTFAWSVTATLSAEAGFSLFGASASVSASLSSSVGASLASRMMSSLEQTASESASFECTEDILYQWSLSGSYGDGITATTFTVKGEDVLCASVGTEPICPPGWCMDVTCETCKEGMYQSAEDPPIFHVDHDPKFPNTDDAYRYPYGFYVPYTNMEWLLAVGCLIILCLAINILVTICAKCERGICAPAYTSFKAVDFECDEEQDGMINA